MNTETKDDQPQIGQTTFLLSNAFLVVNFTKSRQR
jgi:hypothetical protein